MLLVAPLKTINRTNSGVIYIANVCRIPASVRVNKFACYLCFSFRPITASRSNKREACTERHL